MEAIAGIFILVAIIMAAVSLWRWVLGLIALYIMVQIYIGVYLMFEYDLWGDLVQAFNWL